LLRKVDGSLLAARIVETEAYGGPQDLASHARAGRTPRTAPMFGPAGHAYVYLIYGLHHCLNVVTDRDDEAGAVLIRAAEPVMGVAEMRQRRGTSEPDDRLAAGPARLSQALAIDRRHDGADLTRPGELWLARDPDVGGGPSPQVVTGPRVGVPYAGEWAGRPWRFGIAGHPSLSRRF
jgi:DNA-3-methyladenine glycosylase